jgi:hypothetical protein
LGATRHLLALGQRVSRGISGPEDLLDVLGGGALGWSAAGHDESVPTVDVQSGPGDTILGSKNTNDSIIVEIRKLIKLDRFRLEKVTAQVKSSQ